MRVVSFPLSVVAMGRLEFDRCLDGDLSDLYLSDGEYSFLHGLGIFNKINSILMVNIDDYEDEKVVGESDLIMLKSIVIEESIAREEEILKKLVLHVDQAIELKTGVYFYF